MNSEKIFSVALGLVSPWKVSEINFKENETDKELHIWLDYDSGHFVDTSGKSTVHDRVERSWKHLNFFEHQCYLHCRVPRVKDREGKVKRVAVPWAREGSGFTLLFEAYSMCLIEKEMPVNKVGRLVKEYPNRIWTIFNYWIGIAYNAADHSEVTSMGIDETSSKKGHDYITLAVNMDDRSVVHATKGKDSATIEKISNYLKSKGCEVDCIEKVCIDLSPSFISGVTKQFKNASIIFDRYHVKQLLNKAMDTHRKNEYRLHKELKGHKYLFLKSNKNLSEKQRAERNDLIELLPSIGEAYRLKVLFDDFWEMKDEQEAAGFLSYWCDLVQESKIYPLIKFTNTVKAHWSGIINYTAHKITNGVLEGTNSKIQLAKRRARGYRNTNNFINMIYFIAGKLKFNYPLYLT